MKTEKILITLNSIALAVAVFWFINSGYENEPLIAVITLIATLIAMLFSNDKSKRIKVKGNKNKTRQTTENGSVEIEGDENETIQ